jgi:hypothetical protein
MVTRKSWEEFRDSGLLWFINTILHVFGWAIVVDVDIETQEVKKAYPARVKFRGFAEKDNTEGYMKVTKYLKETVEQLEKESLE